MKKAEALKEVKASSGIVYQMKEFSAEDLYEQGICIDGKDEFDKFVEKFSFYKNVPRTKKSIDLIEKNNVWRNYLSEMDYIYIEDCSKLYSDKVFIFKSNSKIKNKYERYVVTIAGDTENEGFIFIIINHENRIFLSDFDEPSFDKAKREFEYHINSKLEYTMDIKEFFSDKKKSNKKGGVKTGKRQ